MFSTFNDTDADETGREYMMRTADVTLMIGGKGEENYMSPSVLNS